MKGKGFINGVCKVLLTVAFSVLSAIYINQTELDIRVKKERHGLIESVSKIADGFISTYRTVSKLGG